MGENVKRLLPSPHWVVSLCVRPSLGIGPLVLTSLLVVNSSVAQEAETATSEEVAEQLNSQAVEAEARSHYEAGVRAFEERRYDRAIDLFHAADTVSPNPAFSFNVGMTYEEMGDPSRALRYYRQYLRRLPTAKDSKQVTARIRTLEGRLQKKGLQQVTVLSEPARATFLIDGVPQGVTPWTGELAPGPHKLEVELRGYKSELRSFDLPPSRAIDVPVTLSPAPIKAPPPTTKKRRRKKLKTACSGASCLGELHPVTWGIGAFGVGTLVAAVLADSLRASAKERADTGDSAARSAALGAVEDHKRWATAFMSVGTVMTLTFGILTVLDLDRARSPAPPEVVGGFGLERKDGGWHMGYRGSF